MPNPKEGATDPHLLQPHAQSVHVLIEDFPQLHSWPACRQVLLEMLSGDRPWQLALPVCASLAAGGEAPKGAAVSAAWIMLGHAANLMNAVQDDVLLPVTALGSPQAALGCASGLIFAAFGLVNTEIKDQAAARRVSEIFAETGFQASRGQALILERAHAGAGVNDSLEAYWQAVILKSGSIFRAGAAVGAAVGTADQNLIAALGDYGTALGVMRQIHDDCRDIIMGPESEGYEARLPMMLYALVLAHRPGARGRIDGRLRPGEPVSQEVLVAALQEVDVPEMISEVLLEWQRRALDCLQPLPRSPAVRALEHIAELAIEPA